MARKKSVLKHVQILSFLTIFVFGFAMQAYGQASSNYKMRGYEFGGGGGVNLDSAAYSLEGILGEASGEQTSSSYGVNSGLNMVQQANTPAAPTFVNTSSWYNKLKLTLNPWSGDPTDATYAIAISTDNFASDTRYIQTDNTIGSVLGAEDFQTYSTWGGASGFFVTGLLPNTTYYVKSKASEGKYTEGGWGPVASVATSALQISFDVDIGGSSDPGETAPPYTVDLGSLTAGSVTTATNRVWLDFATNAEAGGYIFVYDVNAGLKSSNLNYTITSATADLASGAVTQGFGVRGASKTQTSGGPLEYVAPYDGTSDNVGIVNATIRRIFNTSDLPIVGGRGSVTLKAKASAVTPASNDYADTLTMIATAAF